MNGNVNFLLAGVGGQGTILASDVLVNIGLASGFQAKQAEVHGMSQRGGSVTSHVRWGRVVHSPLIGAGEVDVLLAFERLEALRSLNWLRPNALAVVNRQVIEPLTAISGEKAYPEEEQIRQAFNLLTPNLVFINGDGIARELGNDKVANVVLLGALSALLEREKTADIPLQKETWLQVISERVPAKFVDLNRRAFESGRQAAT